MKPDDAPIPRNDAVAGAARSALRRLAEHAVSGSWADVRANARRIQRQRMAAIVAAGTFVLTGAGTAAAVVGNSSARDVHVVDDNTTTTRAATTSTTAH